MDYLVGWMYAFLQAGTSIWFKNTKYYGMELFLFFLWIAFMGFLGVKLYLAHQSLKRAKKKPTP
jgi:uncharacterized membrane protein